MESKTAWAHRAERWLDADYALMTDDAGWQPRIERPDLAIWSRPMPGDKNDLFRWRLPVVNASPETVFEGFVRRLLEYHQEWTREFVGGRLVETLGPRARILYQRFQPGVPGIAARDL